MGGTISAGNSFVIIFMALAVGAAWNRLGFALVQNRLSIFFFGRISWAHVKQALTLICWEDNSLREM